MTHMKTLTQKINAYNKLKTILDDLESFGEGYVKTMEPFSSRLKEHGIELIIPFDWLLFEKFNPKGLLGPEIFDFVDSKFLEAKYGDKFATLEDLAFEVQNVQNKEEKIAFNPAQIYLRCDRSDKTLSLLPFEGISPDALMYLDSINWCLNFLATTVDYKQTHPIIFVGVYRMERALYFFKVFSALRDYLNRVWNLLSLETDILSGESLTKTIDDWENLLTQNKLKELLDIMKSFFKKNGDMHSYKTTIQLQQRFNSNKAAKGKGTKDQNELDLEQNKITEAVIELMFGTDKLEDPY